MTTPKPPKGRRWLKEGEIIKKRDHYHRDGDPEQWSNTVAYGARAWFGTYSRAIPRKTNRKQLK